MIKINRNACLALLILAASAMLPVVHTQNLDIDINFSLDEAPIVSEISIASLTDISATITWLTDKPADSEIEYGLNSSYGSSTQLDSTLVTSHTVTISNLVPGTTYHFRILSADASGLTQPTNDSIFTTVSPPAPPPPPIVGGTGTGGGSGGGFVVQIPVATVPLDSIKLTVMMKPELVTVDVPYDFAIKSISVKSLLYAPDMKIDIKKVSSINIQNPPGRLYRFMRIDTTNTTSPAYIEVEFDINTSWIDSNQLSADDIKLMRYSSGWEQMPTYYAGNTSASYRYKSVLPGFSVFAIVGEKPSEVQPVNISTTNIESTDINRLLEPLISPESEYSVPMQYFVISGAMFILALLIYLYYHHRRSRDVITNPFVSGGDKENTESDLHRENELLHFISKIG